MPRQSRLGEAQRFLRVHSSVHLFIRDQSCEHDRSTSQKCKKNRFLVTTAREFNSIHLFQIKTFHRKKRDKDEESNMTKYTQERQTGIYYSLSAVLCYMAGLHFH